MKMELYVNISFFERMEGRERESVSGREGKGK